MRAGDINEEMKVAAAHALAELISDEELSEDYIIPKAFDHRVGPAVAKAVAVAARRSGVARRGICRCRTPDNSLTAPQSRLCRRTACFL